MTYTTSDIDNFLDKVYLLSRLDKVDSATDLIFDYIDWLLRAGEFNTCNELLLRVDVEKLTTTLMLSFLTITAAAKSKLGARSDMYQRVESRMTRLMDGDVTRHLIGLK